MTIASVENLSSRSLLAVFWGTGGAAARLVLQFGAQVVLARILGPEQYGIFAIGAIVISFSNFFSDIGLAYGLIQKKTVSQNDIRFVFTWQIILGLVVTTVVFVAADGIAGFFGDQRAAGVVQALAAICLLNALAAPSLNLLKRELDFKRIQISQISGFVLGYVVVGIPLALYGSQVWALVAAWVVQAICVLVLAYRATSHPVQPLIYYDEARALGTYGGTVLITNLINWVIANIDRVIVGRLFSSREIGLYATTYNMLSTPTTSILGIIQPVFFSASARLTDNQQKISETYRALLSAIATYVMPVFFAVAAIADTFIEGLYGPKWIDASTILPPIALAMPLVLIWGMTTPLLWTSGHASKEFKTQLPIALLWLTACWLAAHHSYAAVAWSVLGLYFLRCAVLITSASRYLTISMTSIVASIGGGLVVSSAVAAGVSICDAVLANTHAPIRLMADAGIGATTLLACLRMFPALISNELAELNARLLERAPGRVAAALAFLSRR
jgi:O-antigen/teichoic acid export membrane protein